MIGSHNQPAYLVPVEFLRFLRSLYKLVPGCREIAAVLEHGPEGVVIFLPAPPDSDSMSPGSCCTPG
jgi:hypothetical protein